MKIIKHLIPVLLIVSAITACGAGKQADQKQDEPLTKESKEYTIALDQAQFLKKVADFKSNPEVWKYLGDKPAIIDFWAEWCVYCRRLSPVLEELAKEYEGEIYIYKVNTDVEREIAAAFGIRSLPTLLFVPIGEDPQVVKGAIPKEDLKNVIDEFLLNKVE
ncbi:MAG: thioredoxin [Bacteroidia bacterium]|jgi:thioredoxin|nr:thioredoxin [Bacteroidia bacterium]